MLRVYTPASPHPTITGRSPVKQSHADGLRRQIVDMVQKNDLSVQKVNNEVEPEVIENEIEAAKPENETTQEEDTVIFQLRKKSGIASLRAADEKPDRKNDNLKKIHLKILRESRGKGARSFLKIDEHPYEGPIGEDGRISASLDPYKRPRTFSGMNVKGPAKTSFKVEDAKYVRMDDENENGILTPTSPLPHHGVSDTTSGRNLKYEVRGSALRTKSTRSAPMTKSGEATRRHTAIHNSLQLFKRRLKFSHPDHYIQARPSTIESDYVIRRVPMRNDKSQRLPSSSPVFIEPRLQFSSNIPQRIKNPNSLTANPLLLASRPVSAAESSQFGEFGEKKIRYSYRLPDNLNWSKEVSFQDDTEMIPNVNTYVVEPGSNKSNTVCQATLSTHNLGVHNALNSNTDKKVKVGTSDEAYDPRFVRWLEESNTTHSRTNFRSSSASSLPSVRTPEPKIEILETRCKTPFPDK